MSNARSVTFSDQVVIVTGGGRGLGRAYCLEFARRGAAVVVNDVVAEHAGEVVALIEASGGRAAAAHDSVSTLEGARAIIGAGLDRFGTIDAVVNNAGFMRNGYFEDITAERLDEVLDVHARGSFLVTQAAWPVLREKGYGRVVMTSSGGGMYSMPGQSNYAAAKAAVYGLTKALASEGAEHGILVNAVLPNAATTIVANDPVPGHHERFPAGVREALAGRALPEAVAPLVAFLASSACELSGEAFDAGFGRFARVFVGEARGWVAADAGSVTAEQIVEHLDRIRDLDGFAVPGDFFEHISAVAAALRAT